MLISIFHKMAQTHIYKLNNKYLRLNSINSLTRLNVFFFNTSEKFPKKKILIFLYWKEGISIIKFMLIPTYPPLIIQEYSRVVLKNTIFNLKFKIFLGT